MGNSGWSNFNCNKCSVTDFSYLAPDHPVRTVFVFRTRLLDTLYLLHYYVFLFPLIRNFFLPFYAIFIKLLSIFYTTHQTFLPSILYILFLLLVNKEIALFTIYIFHICLLLLLQQIFYIAKLGFWKFIYML